MIRRWFKAGALSVDKVGGRVLVADVISRFRWDALKGTKTYPFSQGAGLKEIIKLTKLRNVEAVGYLDQLAPFSLLGIRARFPDGVADLFYMDTGTTAVPVLSDFRANKTSEVRT